MGNELFVTFISLLFKSFIFNSIELGKVENN